MDARIAVLASGNGTNLQALLDHPTVGPWIALVVSDRPDAFALERARRAGVATITLRDASSPGAMDEPLAELLREHGIDTVVLAGFMRIVGSRFVRTFEDRILNVHPSLLPAFPGGQAVADALAHGAKVTGVTVHLVDEQVDHGPIVYQEPLAIRDDDVWDTLEPRIHEVEHRLLPKAVIALVEGRIKVDGRTVHVIGDPGG
jgi:phosphoribosylglycinamide formyltransferase 1